MIIRIIETKSIDGQDEFNLEDVSYTFIRKCNYADTVQSTVISNLFINYYYELSEYHPLKTALRPAFAVAWASDWYSVATSGMEFCYSLLRLMDRLDYYTIGKMLGKVFKVYV